MNYLMNQNALSQVAVGHGERAKTMKKVTVTVPGSSANLGPGFDCLGLAYKLDCRLTFELVEGLNDGPEIRVEGKLKDVLSPGRDNLIVQTIEENYADTSWLSCTRITIESDIPVTRGLGSSTAALVGALWAGACLSGETPDRQSIFERASEIEGHADNVGPSIFGGMVVTARGNDRRGFVASIHNWPETWIPIVIVPRYEVKTSDARAVLPKEVTMAQAIANIQKTALLVSAVAKADTGLLALSMDDQIHQPYRESLVKEMKELRRLVRDLPAIGMVLSGAGPTMLVLAEKRHADTVHAALSEWASALGEIDVMKLEIDREGIRAYYE